MGRKMTRMDCMPLLMGNKELDIKQTYVEARHRWLHPAEICGIIQNHDIIGINPEAPDRPQSGSLFLLDRTLVRHFRKDGHNWRKETHEKLKDRGIDVLQCFYAHGEDNGNFRRRSYWMLEEKLSHIVLVHYLEVKENRTNFNRIRDADGSRGIRQAEEDQDVSNYEVDGSAASGSQPYDYQRASQVTDTDNHQGQFSAIPVIFGSLTQGEKIKNPTDNGLTHELHQDPEFPSWENVVESSNADHQSVNLLPDCRDPFGLPSLPSTKYCAMTMIPGKENELQARVFTDVSSKRQEFGSNSYTLVNSQASDHDSLNKSNFSMDQMSDENLNLGQNMYFLPPNQPQSYGLVTNLDVVNGAELWETVGLCNPSLSKQNTHPTQNDLLVQALNSVRSSSKSETDVKLYAEDKTDYPALKSRLLGDVLQEGRKMVDSFGCWISEEQGDVQPMEPSSGTFCEIVRSENGDDFGISTQVTLGCHILGPSLSQDQLFSIIEISPKWGYSGSEIKVHVIGRFLGSQEEVKKYKWTCMFGELEVPAEIVVDGVLRCHTPLHETGRVPFYITCSNRLACSEVREFEFRSSSAASRFQSYGGMMAESRHYALNAQLDIDQILLEAQHRWLRPAEICEILQNYKKFCISSEPPTRPASGSLFLFDRKVLRYFRKDGHNWRKKKDGKTVKEAHERLKAGSVDVLHCYYAHGEDNENFQRRSYWMLEEELSHIVLVHYREVKGNRTNFNRIRDANGIPDSRQTEEDISTSEVDSSAASRFQSYDYQRASQVTDTTSLNSTQASEREDSQLAYRHQASPGFQSIHELPSPAEIGSVPYYPVPISDNYQGHFAVIPGMSFGSLTQEKKIKNPTDDSLTYELHQDLEFSDCENVVESSNAGYQSVNFQPSLPSTQLSAMSTLPGEGNELVDEVFTGFRKRQEIGAHSDGVEDFQASDCDSLNKSKWPVDQKSDDNMDLRLNAYYPPWSQPQLYDLPTKLDDVNQVNQVELFETAGLHNPYLTEQSRHPTQNDIKLQALNSVGSTSKSESNVKLNVEDKTNHPALKQPLLGGVLREGLKKLDSFDRWMSKELGDVESTTQPTTGAYWETVGSEDGDDSGISPQVTLDNYILGPSLSQDQLFSIVDFTPNWAYSGSAVKMLVMGKFLRIQEEVEKCKWACMFGELEVPAEIVADGVLQCHTPLHEMGRVAFYITCSNRLACSEVREFEFRSSSVQDVDIGDVGSITSDETLLHMRFGKLLSLGSNTPPASVQCSSAETSKLCGKIGALLKDDTEWEQMLNLTKQDEFSEDKVKDQLLQKLLKEKLHVWLLQKVAEGGKGPSVLDEGGQGVLHFAAALGYDWAIPPTIAAGVSVNFRDANGWTALHWAAYYGRERTVAFLIALGAAPGFVTDPTPMHPSGRTPSDLAASNGHKGIAGYLAESTLISHLSTLELKDSKESDSREKAVETVSEQTATSVGYGDLPHGLSMKDSLAALHNATQAAARIHQVFRIKSFQRRQLNEYGNNEFGMSDERAFSLIALKTKKAEKYDEPVQAAIWIQNKFRSWKGRKEFLLTRQRIIKIQAHVRGHQVRKDYKKIIWSVGVLDEAILPWLRKGRGSSGFKPEELGAGTSMVDAGTKEDDYDLLKEGRKQLEERLSKALDRVRSMVRYPEARDQYRSLLNVVSEVQEKKAVYDKVLNNPEGDYGDDFVDIDALLDDDTLMSTAS